MRIANAINAMQDRMLQMLALDLVCGKLSQVRQGFEGVESKPVDFLNRKASEERHDYHNISNLS